MRRGQIVSIATLQAANTSTGIYIRKHRRIGGDGRLGHCLIGLFENDVLF